MRTDYTDVHTWQELCTSGPWQYQPHKFQAFCSSPTCMGEGKAPANSSNGVLIPEAKFTDVTCPRCNRGWPLYWAKISKFKKKQQIEEEK